MRFSILLLLILGTVSGVSTSALALPQFAVRSADSCKNCHIQPVDWHDPAVELRKCSLSCTTCHVNPSGGGMRAAAGTYYGRDVLPLYALGGRPGDEAVFAPTDRPASLPASSANYGAALENSAERYGGITPNHWWQVGFDVRGMGYFPQDDDNAFFPMQLDLHLAARPYSPEELNAGRLTLLVTTGFEGSRTEQFDNTLDRFFVKEWMAIFHDLPYQLYGKAGRFLPAFGWRLDDHSVFTRQNIVLDNEAQVTGVEVGLNPNYLFLHASVFNPAREWDKPIDTDAGMGTAVHFGWRDFLFQLAGSFMLQARADATEVWAGLNWGLNLHEAEHPWKWGSEYLPIVYLGEIVMRATSPEAGDGRTALAVFHEVDIWPFEHGVNFKLRHDWTDQNLDRADDHRNRYTIGVELHPITGVELIAQYRFNVEPAGRNNNEALIQLHGWF